MTNRGRTPEPKGPDEFVEMSPAAMRQYLESGQQLPELSESQKMQLPPGLGEAYTYAYDSGDPGFLGKALELASDVAESHELKERRRAELASWDYEYHQGVAPSDNNYRAIDHQLLKSWVAPIEGAGITTYSDGYHNLSKVLEEIATELRESIGKSKQGWQGAAADRAHGYFTGLSEWAEGNSQNARKASEVVYRESEAATAAKNSMPEPVPFDMRQEAAQWLSDPLSFDDRIAETIEKPQRSQDAHDEAARVMTQYDADLNEAGNKQPVFAKPPTFSGSDSGAGDTGSGVRNISGTGTQTSASGFAGGAPGGGVPASAGGTGGNYSPGGPLPGGANTGTTPTPGGTAPAGWGPGTAGPGTPGRGGGQAGTGVGPMPVGGPVGA
ncbi:PPE domain-containing protein, partial [Saccharomonospora iraqiensis]|uniref:PPE domain-containing protein n=1 Tax=Saccharomonospora iraqiensis TaxID=52698 RepID=UPI0009FF946B